MNLPNFLTILRILAIPVFVICLLGGRYGTALFVFVGAGITDGLDGLFARIYHQRTRTGAVLDPIADKLMLAAAFVVLAILQLIPQWLTVLVIARDVVIALGFFALFLTSHTIEIKPPFIGKTVTVLQIVTIVWALVTPYSIFMQDTLRYIIWITAVLTCITGLQYIYIGTKYLTKQGG
jgi:cardiolipin synthase